MRRALLLESGRYRAWVTEKVAKIDLPKSELQITDSSDAADLAAITRAIEGEIKAQTDVGSGGMNVPALNNLLAQLQGRRQGFAGTFGGLFGPPYGPHNPFYGGQ